MVTDLQDYEPVDDELKQYALDTVEKVEEKMSELRVADAIQDILDLFSRCNKYIDETMPWALAKDPEKTARLTTVLYNLLECVRIAAVLLKPYLPDTAEKILDSLNTEYRDYDSLVSFGQLEPGTLVTEKPEILFARINPNDIMPKIEEQIARQKKEAEETARINEERRKAEERKNRPVTVDDFDRFDLRVGKVIGCVKHPNADKLYILVVDLGESVPRQIVSGLAQSYTPGQLIGKKVVVIANLAPAEIRGVESQGMLLAGKEGGVISVVEANNLQPGTRIS